MTRDQLYQSFGPLLLEAICLIIKDEINLLRQEHGLALRTNEQILNAIETKLASLGEYSWM